MKKEDYVKMLQENEVFKAVLKKAPNDTDKRIIKAYAEDFVEVFYEQVFEPFSKAIENDPELLNKVYSEIEKSLINSGSQEV